MAWELLTTSARFWYIEAKRQPEVDETWNSRRSITFFLIWASFPTSSSLGLHHMKQFKLANAAILVHQALELEACHQRIDLIATRSYPRVRSRDIHAFHKGPN